MLSLDEPLKESTSSSKTKFFFPLHSGLLLLFSGMQMLMLVRALNVEAGSSVLVFNDATDGKVLGGSRIVSSAVLVGSTTAHVIV